jgi:hypothetical protein
MTSPPVVKSKSALSATIARLATVGVAFTLEYSLTRMEQGFSQSMFHPGRNFIGARFEGEEDP